MITSYFEALRYRDRDNLPTEWPMPPVQHQQVEGAASFEQALDICTLVEDVGFDWVSLSEHHYALTQSPTPIVAAGYLASHLKKAKVAMLGPHMPLNNPVRVAEEIAMLDQLAGGRVVVGLLRGTPNEYQVYSVNPAETRARTSEGMEIVLKAWTEPYPFAWQGRHYNYRMISVWPRPCQTPFPPTYVLGSSPDSARFAAKHHLGLGLSFGGFDMVGISSQNYRRECEAYGWEPEPEQIIYRSNILIAETDDKAHEDYAIIAKHEAPAFPMRPSVRDAVMALNNVEAYPGSRRPQAYQRPLPMTFFGSPQSIVEQVKECREVVGAGAIDFLFQSPHRDAEGTRKQIELFGDKVMPHIKGL